MRETSNTGSLGRRRFPYPCTRIAEILQSGKSWEWGKVCNVRRSGCYVETVHPLPTGAKAQLRLTISGVSLEICAKVVSSHPMFGMEMDFVRTEQWNRLTQTSSGRLRVRVAAAFKKVEDATFSPAVNTNVREA